MAEHAPGPWTYVPGTEHHGPYVTTDYGTTVADCYAMSNPLVASLRNGGTSFPIPHMAEMAEPNARLIAAAPEMSAALAAIDDWWAESFPGGPDGPRDCWAGIGRLSDETLVIWRQIRAALAKAREGASS